MKFFRFALVVFVATTMFSTVSNAQSDSPSTSSLAESIRANILSLESQKGSLNAMLETLQAKLDRVTQSRLDSIKKQDSIGVSAESFPEIMKTLQSQRIQLTIDLAGLQARRNALAKAKEDLLNDAEIPALDPLHKILVIEKQKLARVKELVDQGVQSESQLLAARSRVLAAEVKIAETKSRYSQSNYTDRINSDLLDASLDRAEKQARLESTESLLEILKSSRVLVEKATATESAIITRRDQIEQLNAELADLEARIIQLNKRLAEVD